MENKHTPEPWKTDAINGFPCDVEEMDGNLIAQCKREKDARRIVSCVNACKVITNDDLDNVVKNPIYSYLELMKQRDELLAAAESIYINAEECLDWDDCTAMLVSIDSYHKLMEAIANAKENKK